jgi:hypothetical protein
VGGGLLGAIIVADEEDELPAAFWGVRCVLCVVCCVLCVVCCVLCVVCCVLCVVCCVLCVVCYVLCVVCCVLCVVCTSIPPLVLIFLPLLRNKSDARAGAADPRRPR